MRKIKLLTIKITFMKSKFYIFLTVVILLATVVAACKKEKQVTSVTVSPTTLILYMNTTATLTATVHPIDATNKAVIWTSSNNNVATVDNGKITAITQGTAIITATTEEGNHTAICTVEVLHPLEPELVFVEGSTDISSFKIAKFLLTGKRWYAIMFGDTLILPDGGVPARADEEEVIQKLNEITGKNYRLPTYAEWEYAARGGNKSKGYKYSGSNDIDEVAWYEGNSLDEFGIPIHHLLVGTKKPNELGIYDMSGLVWEVCSDWCEPYYEGMRYPVVCGGSIRSSEQSCRLPSASCGFSAGFYIGIRLILP
jgi:hypothetical protein